MESMVGGKAMRESIDWGTICSKVASSAGPVVYEDQLDIIVGWLNTKALTNTGPYRAHLRDATRWITGAKLHVE